MNKDILTKHVESFERLENIIDYSFKNKKNLLLALTHSSYANEKRNEGLSSNERLEFLGDAVLNIVISDYIFKKRPNLSEGEMSKTRASMVCESALMKCAESIKLGSFIMLGKGEENTGGRQRASILSDAFEAVIGAIYIDGGIEKASKFIFMAMSEIIGHMDNSEVFIDYKTKLQEVIQKTSEDKIFYQILEEKGPDHDKEFVIQLSIGNNVLGTGVGKSKKEAEQNAAKAALAKLKVK